LIAEARVVVLDYADEKGSASTREIQPLCLAFWGGAWTLGAWCRLRRDFRNFRLDRIHVCEISTITFVDDAATNFGAYLRAMESRPR